MNPKVTVEQTSKLIDMVSLSGGYHTLDTLGLVI